jgi:hypothetical protein
MKRLLEPDQKIKSYYGTVNIAHQTTKGSPQFSEWRWIYLIDKVVLVF